MADEELMQLLREMRDLQKQHVENYKEAVRNQQTAIDLQAAAARRQKWTLLVLGLVLVASIAVLYLSH